MFEEIFSQFNLEIFWQLALAGFLGTLMGIEREIAKKKAGMRTFALVSLGSCLFSIISINALRFLGDLGMVSFDPTRIASQIVTGLGFLGAGIIIFDSSKLRGVTTAAGLWLAAAIGMAVGFKFYAVAIFTTIVALFIFVFLWAFEERIIKRFSYRPAGSDRRFED
ncbi:MAG: MgtC/SapB family protein [Candidatus Liptonbacteria bacterium]|nr:MgtC/SapB family protein [Candidatus Liptonbacteria bacterium]